MNSLKFKKALTIVLLGLGFNSPSLYASDNLHSQTVKEARTYLPHRAIEDCNEAESKNPAEDTMAKRAKRLPLEEFWLNRNSRGPALLH